MKILVISDIHGNAEALSAILATERDYDTVVFLGDAVLCGPQPNETMDLLRGLQGTFIQGNHDLELLEPGFLDGWPPPWRAWNRWIVSTLDSDGFRFLESLKRQGEYRIGELHLHLSHGVHPDHAGYLLPDAPDDRFVGLAAGDDSPVVLFGHSHVQFRRTVGNREFINPGSVGQNRCGRVAACYGLFVDGQFSHHRVAYDPTPWLEAMDRISPLDQFPDFREEFKQGLLKGYALAETEPWTRFADEGYH